MNKKGFTLLELMIVIIILGVLAALAVPRYRKVIEKGKQAEAINNLGMLRQSLLRYAQMDGKYTQTWADLDMEQPTTTDGTARYFSYTLLSVATFGTPSTDIAEATRNTTANPGYGTYTLTIEEGGDVVTSGF